MHWYTITIRFHVGNPDTTFDHEDVMQGKDELDAVSALWARILLMRSGAIYISHHAEK